MRALGKTSETHSMGIYQLIHSRSKQIVRDPRLSRESPTCEHVCQILEADFKRAP